MAKHLKIFAKVAKFRQIWSHCLLTKMFFGASRRLKGNSIRYWSSNTGAEIFVAGKHLNPNFNPKIEISTVLKMGLFFLYFHRSQRSSDHTGCVIRLGNLSAVLGNQISYKSSPKTWWLLGLICKKPCFYILGKFRKNWATF